MMSEENVAAHNAPAQHTMVLTATEEPDSELIRPRDTRHPVPYASIAFAISLIFLIAEGVAVYLASSGKPASASVIAQILIVATFVSFGLAGFATVRGPRRGWAIAAMIVSVIANPLILLQVLTFFGSL